MSKPDRRKVLARGLRQQGRAGERRALTVGRIVAVGITIAMIAVLVRVGQLQLRPTERIRELIDSQRSSAKLLARRGNLLDRQGRVIAATRTASRLFVDPLLIEDPNTFSEHVGYGLGYDPASIEKRIDGSASQRYVVIDQQLSAQREALLKDLDLSGLETEARLVRDYPQGTLAGQLIGFVGLDGRGLEGLELALDPLLLGTDGSMRYWRDSRRRPLWVRQGNYQPPADGRAITLSLDLVVQTFAEKALSQACQEYGAPSGQMIVMDPFTGEMLAMANFPCFAPDDGGNGEADLRRNRCVTDVFEPGSVFKPFVWSAATEAGLARPEEQIDCRQGFWVSPKGRRLHDAHGYGLLTWEYVLVKSSNIGMATVGLRLGARRMHTAVRAFGFGTGTDSGLPGEVNGLVNPVDTWTHYSVTSVPMGQEIAVTALQLVRGFCAFANGGMLVTPTIRRLSDGREQVVYDRILSARTANITRRALRRVVTDGTGRKAKPSVYQIFGKTGTAQVPGPGGYLPDRYTAVFVCGAPVDNPRIVVACVIHRPDKSKGYYGGTVAAPAAVRVVDQTLAYMGVPIPHESTSGSDRQLARH